MLATDFDEIMPYLTGKCYVITDFSKNKAKIGTHWHRHLVCGDKTFYLNAAQAEFLLNYDRSTSWITSHRSFQRCDITTIIPNKELQAAYNRLYRPKNLDKLTYIETYMRLKLFPNKLYRKLIDYYSLREPKFVAGEDKPSHSYRLLATYRPYNNPYKAPRIRTPIVIAVDLNGQVPICLYNHWFNGDILLNFLQPTAIKVYEFGADDIKWFFKNQPI